MAPLLLDLPQELLNRIALHCSGRCFTRLRHTCRRMQTLCTDTLVLRDAVELQLNGLGTVSRTKLSKQMHYLDRRAGADGQAWIRYKTALDEIAELPEIMKMIPPTDWTQSGLVGRAMSFMPQLIALECAPARSTNTASLLTATGLDVLDTATPRISGVDLLKLGFCFAAEQLRCGSGSYLEELGDEQIDTCLWNLRESLVSDLRIQPEDTLQEVYRFYLLLGMFSRTLKTDGAPVPWFDSIPLTLHENAPHLPIPYESCRGDINDPWFKWLQSTVEILASKSEIEAVDWVGFISNDPFMLSQSGPLEGIRFSVDETKTTCRVEGVGVEGSNKFTLKGEIKKPSGEFNLLQEYTGSHHCEWHGFVTPFGLISFIHLPQEMSEFMGFSWIWKRDWLTAV